MYGPTGLGILYGKKDILEEMQPYQGGGEMIREVDFEGTTYNDLPFKFEAGTPNIADVIAFEAAINYLDKLGRPEVREWEEELRKYGRQRLSEISNLRFIGDAEDKTAIFSFLLGEAHSFDVGMMLDAKGIAVRTGHHCTQPLMKHYGIEGTIRASLTFYNSKEEVDYLVESLKDIDKKLN
jgi:cysteine desulfurase/selenocysteine lyase